MIRRIGTDDCYVGHSIDVFKRWGEHRNLLKAGKHTSPYLQRTFNKHGMDIFSFEILQVGLDPTREALETAERKWMDILMPCYNGHKVMGSKIGFRHSEETKAKLRAANVGKKLSAETRALMSAQRMGNKHRAGHKPPWTGKKRSAETNARIAIAKKGSKGPNPGIPRTDDVKRQISMKKRGVPWSVTRRAAFEQSKAELLQGGGLF